MERLFVALCSVALLAGADSAEQPKPAGIQGVWQVLEVTITGPGARTIAVREGSNLTIITGKHYSRVEVHADGKRPMPADVTKASADELRAAWGPFVGEAGTYEATNGNLITMRPIVSKNPDLMSTGVVLTYSYKLDGDTLWVTSRSNQNGRIVNPVTVKAVRVE